MSPSVPSRSTRCPMRARRVAGALLAGALAVTVSPLTGPVQAAGPPAATSR